jgi:hypothetical protein
MVRAVHDAHGSDGARTLLVATEVVRGEAHAAHRQLLGRWGPQSTVSQRRDRPVPRAPVGVLG